MDTEYDLSLIAQVKRNPILYNNKHADFKCCDLKMDKWREIAKKLRQSSDENSVAMVRKRWKSLRDYLVKASHCRNGSTLSDSNAKNWRYAKVMAFLVPYLGEPNPAKGIRYKKRVSKTKQTKAVEKFGETQVQIKECPGDTASNDQEEDIDSFFIEDVKPVVEEPRNTICNDNQDDVDSFFKGIADTVKKLSPENRVRVQRDIVNMVLDVKLWEIQKTKNTSEYS